MTATSASACWATTTRCRTSRTSPRISGRRSPRSHAPPACVPRASAPRAKLPLRTRTRLAPASSSHRRARLAHLELRLACGRPLPFFLLYVFLFFHRGLAFFSPQRAFGRFAFFSFPQFGRLELCVTDRLAPPSVPYFESFAPSSLAF